MGKVNLVIDDTADNAGQQPTISATSVVKLASATVAFNAGTLLSLTLNGGGSGGNTFTVQATPSGVPVTINAGAGDDVVNVGSAANSIDNVLGALTVNGQGGNNILNINDGGNTPIPLAMPHQRALCCRSDTHDANRPSLPGVHHQHRLYRPCGINLNVTTSSSVTVNNTPVGTTTVINGGSSGDTVTINNASSPLTFNGGIGNDTITLNAVAASGLVTINGGAGNDTITAGGGGGGGGAAAGMSGIRGSVSIDAGAGTDSVTFDDSGSGAAGVYTLSAASLILGAITTSYANAETINLMASNGGANTITVTGTSKDTTKTTITGGSAGNTFSIQGTTSALAVVAKGNLANPDAVNIGDPATNNVAAINGAVSITDPPGFAAITIGDAGDGSSRTVSVGSGAITGLAPAAINYNAADVKSLNVTFGNLANTVTVQDTPFNNLAMTPTTFATGNGNNTINVLATTGPLTINEGVGNSTVTVGRAATAAWHGHARQDQSADHRERQRCRERQPQPHRQRHRRIQRVLFHRRGLLRL